MVLPSELNKMVADSKMERNVFISGAKVNYTFKNARAGQVTIICFFL